MHEYGKVLLWTVYATPTPPTAHTIARASKRSPADRTRVIAAAQVGSRGHEYCFAHENNPLARVAIEGDELRYRIAPSAPAVDVGGSSPPSAGEEVRHVDARAGLLRAAERGAGSARQGDVQGAAAESRGARVSLPLLMHSNGAGANGKKLSHDAFRCA
eukprot:7026116-Prymnesium_polylepis.2